MQPGIFYLIQYCKNQHNLVLKYKTNTLRFCDGCMKVLCKDHFACPEGCGYELCLDCSHKAPGFVGTALDEFINAFSGGEDIEQGEEEEFNFNNIFGNNDEQEEVEEGENFNIDFGDFW